MTSDASFLDWLRVFGRDLFGELDPDSPQTEPDKIEEFLWRLEHGFLHGNDAVAGPLAPYGDLVQYLSLPLYSHVKEQRTPKKPWLTCFPLFVGTGNVDGDAPVAARYLRLYHALDSDLIKFSFTGFAGNAELGLDTIPRFLLLSTDDGDPSFTIDSDVTGGSLHFKVSLPAVQITDPDAAPPADFLPTGRPFTPFVEKDVDEITIRRWWEHWGSAAGALETSKPADMDFAKHAVFAQEKLAGNATVLLQPLLKGADGDTRARHQRLAEGLIRFLAWNHALGFRRIVYLPFASASPAGITWKPSSWGGLIAVLRNDAPLESLFEALGRPSDTTAPAGGRQEALPRYVSFSMLCRAFVDLAVARVVAFDWAKFTREVKRPHLRRTARAAIMSRNLSHNIGSHALANAHLFEAVGVLDVESVPPKPKDDQSACVHRSKPPTRDATADGQYPVSQGEVWRARNRLGSLNSYLQGRMDFIARALGESVSHPEPMYFVGELLRGFLSQTVLLNTLLSDHGFHCEKMEFHVSLPGSSKPLIFRKKDDGKGQTHNKQEDHELRHASFDLDSDSASEGFHDLLVGVPGGMVGRHAFYAFLENVMRNAAKYGREADAVARDPKQRFVISLRLSESVGARLSGPATPAWPVDSCFQLTITDNLSLVASDLSSASTPRPVPIRIREHLAKDVIDEKEQIQTEGHGIQEMKLCAHFLAGGDSGALVFPDDDSCLDGRTSKADSYESFVSRLAKSAGYENRQTDPTPPGWIRGDARSSLRSFTTTCTTDHPCAPGGSEPLHEHLAYSLILQQPTLLGIVAPGPRTVSEPPPLRRTEGRVVMEFGSVKRLASEAAYFGLLLPPLDGDLESFLDDVSRHHSALPFRLMVGVRTEAERVSWSQRIQGWQQLHEKAWWDAPPTVNGQTVPFPLPARRLHVVCVPTLLALVADGQQHPLPDWRQEINRLYDRWLLAYKGAELDQAYPDGGERRWHLLLGFDRPHESVRAQWGPAAISPAAGPTPCIQVHLYGKNSEGKQTRLELEADARRLWDIDQLRASQPSLSHAILALDNHGSAFPVSSRVSTVHGQAAYHPFSGSEQVSLFQLLESPPLEPDSRLFLVYSVVEALLTRVFVIDERVAEATIQHRSGRKTLMGDRAAAFARARIHPVYSVWTERDESGTAKSARFLPSVVLEAPLDADQAEVDERGHADLSEGLHVSPLTRSAAACQICTLFLANGRRIAKALSTDLRPDVVVLHEGVVDKIHDWGGWPEALHHQLHAICPWVVRTSGRGATARHLGKELPFLEFSELSDATYRQMNKVALGKALLSVRGLPVDALE
jgi:hypothetical protein